MRRRPLAIAIGAVIVLSGAAGIAETRDAQATATRPRTIWTYRSSFTPSMLTAATGVVVTLVNYDTIAHRIVLDRGKLPTTFDVTLAPGQRYTLDPLECRGSCSTITYTFRDADRSYVDPRGYCATFCARLDMYNDGT